MRRPSPRYDDPSADEIEAGGGDLITCPAGWTPGVKGYVRVVHPTTGEVADIPYSREFLTEVWKEDIRRIGAARRGR
jgi:hypothetical protein